MAIYLWRYCRVNKKKYLSVSVHRAGREIDSAILKPSRQYLTIGGTYQDDLNISLPCIPPKHRLVASVWRGHALLIPSGLEGDITIGPNTLPVKGLIDFGLLKKRGKHYLFHIPKDIPCLIRLGDATLSFIYTEAPRKENKSRRVERSLKKNLIARENYAFLLILLISAAINFSAAGYLNTIEIIKVEHTEVLKNIPQRFAKLILKPKEKKEIKVAAKPKPEEKEAPQKAEEQKKKEERVAAEQPPVSSRGADYGSTVKSKGLLGLITAKTKPVFLSDDLFETGDLPQSGRPASALDGQGQGLGGGIGEGGSREVLAGLSVKGLDRAEIDTMTSAGRSQDKKARETAEILKERRAVPLESSEKGRQDDADKGAGGKRNEGDVSRTVQSYIGGVKYLYNNALRKDPSLKGKITVKIVVSPDGKVAKVEKVASTLNLPELEDAIVNRVYKWQFSEVRGADDFVITYTFDFSPTS